MITDPRIAHIADIFDIVGKTVDNVSFSPAQNGEGESITIDFTDGSVLTLESGETDGIQ